MASQGAAFSLDSAPDAILVLGSDGRIVFANRQVEALLGYGRDELLDQPIEYVIPEGAAEAKAVRGNAGADYGSQAGACIHRDGTRFPAALQWKAAARNGDEYIVLSIRSADAATADRRSAYSTSGPPVDLFSLFNHDIRQSLQSIQFLCDSLARKAPDTASNISEIVDSIKSLLDTILRLNDSGTIKAEDEACSLSELLHALGRELRPVAERKGLRLDIDLVDEQIRTDPVLLRELLQNLVANAVRYTDAGTVSVRCRSSRGSVRIDVADTGIGMAGDQLEGILAGTRGSTAARRAGEGSGLGLAIAQRLAVVLGCRIEVNSIPGVGSTFSVTVPRWGARRDPMRVSATMAGGAGRGGTEPGETASGEFARKDSERY